MCNLSADLYFRHVFPPLSNNTSCKSLLKTKMLPRSVECWRHRGEYNGPNKRFTSPLLWVGSDQVRTTFLVGMILRLLKVRYLWANFILKMILIIWCAPYSWWWLERVVARKKFQINKAEWLYGVVLCIELTNDFKNKIWPWTYGQISTWSWPYSTRENGQK